MSFCFDFGQFLTLWKRLCRASGQAYREGELEALV